MDASPRPRGPDLEFEAPLATPPVRLRPSEPTEHQRLVVNPFLAVLAGLGWLDLVARLLDGRFPPILIPAILGLGVIPWLIQYHCLDCGRTGSYPWRHRHACPSIALRSSLAETPGSILPSARGQLMVWAWIIGAVAILLVVNSQADGAPARFRDDPGIGRPLGAP